MDIKGILKNIHDETTYGEYLGGTLSSNGYVFNFDKYGTLDEWKTKSGLQRDYTKEEKYWWCKCYLKYKSETYHYHQRCLKYIEGQSGEFGSDI